MPPDFVFWTYQHIFFGLLQKILQIAVEEAHSKLMQHGIGFELEYEVKVNNLALRPGPSPIVSPGFKDVIAWYQPTALWTTHTILFFFAGGGGSWTQPAAILSISVVKRTQVVCH